MKKTLLILIIALMSINFIFAQTAKNFNCSDCSGTNHDLFTELNSGKIIVITWVMPCGSCISGGLAAQVAAQSFSVSYTGQVVTYIADDNANTSCTTLSSWCTTNGINPDAKFSNSAVNMTGYGTAGMPKVVVLGGTSHTVYYNQNNNAVTQSGIQNAINSAIAANATGINDIENGNFGSANVFPNPASTSCSLSFNLTKKSTIKIEIQNLLGQKISEVFSGDLKNGENSININTNELSNGNYLIHISDGNSSKKLNMIINK